MKINKKKIKKAATLKKLNEKTRGVDNKALDTINQFSFYFLYNVT